jgi:ABC-type branched-subunit amino acid transport system ATPase component
MLEVDHVNLHYGAAIALRQVSLTAEVGAVTCLLGRNGVGKTSLLRASYQRGRDPLGGRRRRAVADP